VIDALTGTRIRQKRLDLRMRQVDLAQQVGISASYLNLIEHNRRRIGGGLLRDLAQTLKTDPQQLQEGAGARTLEALNVLDGPDQSDEFATKFPDWAAFVLDQAKQIAAMQQTISGLDDRLSHDPVLSEKMHDVLSTVSAIRSTSSILVETPDLDTEWRSRFHANIDSESRRLAETSAAMASHFDQIGREGSGFATPLEAVHTFFEEHGFHLESLERKGADAEIELLLNSVTNEISANARALIEVRLRSYLENARVLPLDAFLETARAFNFDPVAIASEFRCPLDQVLTRMGHLPVHPDVPEIGYVECDIAGGLLMRRPTVGFAMPRFGAACPVWPLFDALTQPGRPLREVLKTAEGRLYDTHALASFRLGHTTTQRPVLTATMVLVGRVGGEDGASEPALRVGASCRVCSAPDCAARREASILQDVGASSL